MYCLAFAFVPVVCICGNGRLVRLNFGIFMLELGFGIEASGCGNCA